MLQTLDHGFIRKWLFICNKEMKQVSQPFQTTYKILTRTNLMSNHVALFSHQLLTLNLLIQNKCLDGQMSMNARHRKSQTTELNYLPMELRNAYSDNTKYTTEYSINQRPLTVHILFVFKLNKSISFGFA